MTSKNGGTVGKFVNSPDFPFKDQFKGLTPGTHTFILFYLFYFIYFILFYFILFILFYLFIFLHIFSLFFLSTGSPAFSAKWKEVASANPTAFKNAEHSYIQKTHYDPLANKIKTQSGTELNN